MVNEDWEREHLLDQMYLIELQQEIEQEYQQYSEEQEKLPAIIEIIKNPEYDTKRKNSKENQESTLL